MTCEWQPMNTAPMDGTRIVAKCNINRRWVEPRVVTGLVRKNGTVRWASVPGDWDCVPMGWAPIPETGSL